MKEVYLDNAATTPMTPAVIAEMTARMKDTWGNASTGYSYGRQAKLLLENSRHILAQSINADDDEIVITSGGTESDNTAIIQTAFARQKLGKHIISTAIEHEAVLKPLHFLEEQGFTVTYLPVDENGNISLADFKAALRDDTILVTIMAGNNEVGSRMPIHEIGEILADHQAWFHTDAVQAYGLLPIDVKRDHIDLLSTSAHKLNGPKMMGFLYRRNGINFPSYLKGGDQETKRRAGTENVPGIVGYGAAAKRAAETMEERTAKERELRDYLIKRITEEIPYVKLNGDPVKRLPNNVNVSFRFVEGESLLLMLDGCGICASSGSACTSGSLDPSHVLLAIGLPHEIAHGSLRLTLSEETTREDLDYTVENLKEIVQNLRNMSPLYEDFLKHNGAEGKN